MRLVLMLHLFFVAAAALPFSAAATDETDEKVTETPTGLKIVDLIEGSGPRPKKGQLVWVHYTGWLEDGTKFDTSLDRNEPLSFRVGQGRVIRGWDEGIATMKIGGKRRLIIPPRLGYGDRGAGRLIPPDATLIFEVERLQVR